jgi:NPCBM/NEW2 domain
MLGTRHFAFGLALTALAVVPGFTRGDGPSPPGGMIPSDPVFTALLTDGSTVSGQIRRLGEKDGVTLVNDQGDERPIPLDRLVKLTREGASPPSTTEGGDIVLFPDGDRLARCKIGQTGEFNLGVHSFALEDLSIPLESILGLLLDPGIDSGGADSMIARVRAEPHESELVWLKNGDKLPGLLAGLDDKKLSFQPATGKVELPRSDVDALGFAQGQVVYRRPEGPYLELTLGDGSRLGVTGARIERGQVVATTRFKTPVRLPIGELAQVHVINGAVAYLSDRESSGTIYEPYLGPTRPYRRNASVSGEGLRLGGRVFDRGLGTQSRTLLAYKLEPGSKRFQALVGLDDRAGPLGNVVFKVRVDDKIVYESATMVAGEAPKLVDLDVNGARFLILMTEFGERGDVQDHANWVEARIVR